ncbi:MAG: AMP-binding protein [Alphaproteobacteria bacterium]|nr:AMP-binding protein [Alphaproteobacteria bacterium]
MPDAANAAPAAAETPAATAANAEDSVVGIARGLAREIHPHRRAAQRAGLDSSLDQDWGFDSLTRAELLLRVERAFGVRLPEHLLGEAETLRDLLSALGRARATLPGVPEIVPHVPAAEPAEPAPQSAATLTEVLDWHVRQHAERVHIVLVHGDGHESTITYRDLAERSRAVARGLAQRGLELGERVALMLPTGRDFFTAFYGVLYAGGVPTPIYPPARLSQIEEHLRRQAGILRNGRAAILIAAPQATALAQLLRLQVDSLRSIETVEALGATGDAALPDTIRGEWTALLQYTSGSTGDPKGVVLSHANLLANIRAMGEAMAAGPTDVFVSWLPLYHDMGLIGAWLGSLYFAAPLVVMSPLSFLVRPEQWLWAIHRHRATLSAAPNFAFELCLRKVEDAAIAGLDLSTLRMVANGSEAVSPDTIRRFAARFARYGFRAGAMTPVYGLAENAVGLAFPPLDRVPVIDRIERAELARHGRATPAAANATDALEFVACGRPLPGHHIRIIDAAGEVGERQEGRLQFRGPSATLGYLDNPGKNRELFDGPWLNTGDLAYVADGDIFITGRSKDIVIRAGRHIYPEEIETAVGDVDAVRKGCVAVFGAPDPRAGTERLVVVAETRETDPQRLAALRQRVEATAARLLDAPPEEVVLMPPGSVPKTSSGKLRRAATRELFLRGRLGARPHRAARQLARLVLAGLGAQLRRQARALVGLAYAAWWWSVLVLTGAVVWPLVILTPGPAARWTIAHRAARLLLRLMAIRVEIVGDPRAAEGHIVAINHSSYFDSLVLAAVLPGRPAFVAKRELGAQLVAGPFLRALGTLFVERDDAEGGVEDTRKALLAAQAGRTLVFFPEGTLTRVTGLRPFRLGAFAIAVRQRVGVLPVTLRGTRLILRGEQWLPRHGAVSVHFGAPCAVDGDDFAAAVRLRDRVRAAILSQCGEPDLGPG